MGTYGQRVALTQIVGKTISGIVMTEGGAPASQLFLVFSDNTYYELYTVHEPIVGSSHVNDGGIEDVRESTAGREIVREIVDTISNRPTFSADIVTDSACFVPFPELQGILPGVGGTSGRSATPRLGRGLILDDAGDWSPSDTDGASDVRLR